MIGLSSTEGLQKRSATLFAILAGLSEGGDRSRHSLNEDRYCYESGRRLVHSRVPKTGEGNIALLGTVLEAKMLINLELKDNKAKMYEWEKMCSTYETLSSILIQDAVKEAILTKNAPKELQEHLLMNSGKYPDANARVDAIQGYALHKHVWTPDSQGHAPMDIGA